MGEPAWAVEAVERFRGASSVDPWDVAQLARSLADSGRVRATDDLAHDVASTGGPSSLTTFLSPLVLVSDGWVVPKVGVPGRPAGVVDAFGSLPEYRVSLTSTEFEVALRRARYVNALAAADFAPADRELFETRQRMGAQQVPALVVASLLSKKVAVGLVRCTIDIRVGQHGNFGQDVEAGHQNAALLVATGAILGIHVTPVITAGRGPLQPYIGRLESLMAVCAVLDGEANTWLASHFDSCVDTARAHDVEVARGRKPPDLMALREVLDANLRAQGYDAGYSGMRRWIEGRQGRASYFTIRATRSGQVDWQLSALRAVVVREQARFKGTSFADPCGVEILARNGWHVDAGEEIARLRIDDPSLHTQLQRDVEAAAFPSMTDPVETGALNG